MAQHAKRRTKAVSQAPQSSNGNGTHKTARWIPGDPIENHPLASAMGAFKDDPTWEEFIQHMKDFRREELERDLKNLETEK